MSHIRCSRTNSENYNVHFVVIKKAIELHSVCMCVLCVENKERNPIFFCFVIVFVKKAMKFLFYLFNKQQIHDSLVVLLYDN